jgi:hypothetical protein
MGASKRDLGKPNLPKASGVSGTREQIEAAFRAAAKKLRCPNCDCEFTDYAVDWGGAWLEGRIDHMREDGRSERDGPFKMKCELCGHRAWTDVFLSPPRSAESTEEGG